MALIYILKSKVTNKRYTGSTRFNDIEFRLRYHNSGKVKSTKAFRPWIVIYTEEFKDYTLARKREHFFKSGVGRKVLKQILATIK